MLLFLMLFCWGPSVVTSGQVWSLYGTPRKTLTLSSYGGHVFQEEGVWNYSTMLLREDMGVLILGARETIFALDLNNIIHKKAMVNWEAIPSMRINCSSKGKDFETECQNYIRILHKLPDGRMYVCGTNAFNPTCDYMSYTDGNLVLENNQHEGTGRCPFDPFKRSASELVDGELYSATTENFLGTKPVMMRSLKQSIRTEFGSSWLWDPNFISMKHVAEGEENPEGDDDKIYLFFSETAKEFNHYQKLDVSRVARVCKGDLGVGALLQKNWTSFQKARLDCSFPETKLPFLIQDVFLFCPGNWSTCVFYGVFTLQTDMSQYSAVCAYRIQDIREVFSKSKFKTVHRADLVTAWKTFTGNLPDPRPGACINNDARQKGIFTSLNLPVETLEFIRDKPLMDQAVEPSSQQPLLVKKGAEFTSIVVASTTALDGSIHQVMFIGTASGSVLKAVNYNGETMIIEEVQLFAHSEPVKILRLSTTVGQLYAGSEVAAVQMPLSSCDHYTSCRDCVLARDPYCGWDLTTDSCVAINSIHTDTHSEVVQSLRDGNASHCPAVDRIKTIKFFYPGNTVSLVCEPGSNLAQVQWHVNGRPVEKSNVYQIQHNTLLILNASERDTGHYTCYSVETSMGVDYVTQTAEYELRVQGQQSILLAFKVLVIILTLILLSLVIWNVYKGYLSINSTDNIWLSGVTANMRQKLHSIRRVQQQ
ncbi:semaphorin-4E-like isoform X1, partial [Clarias magur]